jgi:hypothetical protein
VITEEQSFYWSIYQILSYPAVWLCFLLSGVMAVIPDILIKIVENTIEEYSKSNELKRVNNLDKASTDLPKAIKEQRRKRDCKALNFLDFSNKFPTS